MTKETLEKYISFCEEEGFNIRDLASPQRKAVLSNQYSIIPAGAGSGKTTVLTYRFLRLLMDDEIYPPMEADQILTITFTKDATANMKSRIYNILKKAVNKGILDPHHLDTFTKAEISTTDSFCARILREDSRRFGLSPDFSMEETDDLEVFASRTLRSLLDDMVQRDDDIGYGLRSILSLTSINDLADLYKDYAANDIRLEATPYTMEETTLNTFMEETAAMTEKLLEPVQKSLIELLEKKIPELRDAGEFEEDITKLEGYLDTIKNRGILGPKFELSQKRGCGFTDFKNEFKSKAYTYDCLAGGISDADARQRLKAYGALSQAFQKEVIDHKRKSGLLTFSDVMKLSIEILRANKDLRNRYQTRYRRIMVDEFQDNNEDNKRLVYLLAAKDDFEGKTYPKEENIHKEKIFMVGDEKQSIYRFRGADVSVFRNISKNFGEDRILALNQNYRSEKFVIDKINRIFKNRIMAEHNSEAYEADYISLESNHRRIPHSQVKFLYMDGRENSNIDEDGEELPYEEKKTDNGQSEAYEIARFIEEEIIGKPQDYPIHTKDNSYRNPQYSDIAILLRSTSHQSTLEKALKLFQIPFTANKNKSLTQDAVLCDFYNLLQVAVYGKEDEISYFAFLNSPFTKLNLEHLSLIARGKRENLPLDYHIKTKELQEEFERADAIIDSVAEKLKTSTISQTLDYIWSDLGYRYFIQAKEKNRIYEEHYDYLFSIGEAFDNKGKGIVSFLDKLRPLLGAENKMKDISIQMEETAGVTIQTIHGSKGLEYPIVIVADLASKRNPPSSMCYVLEEKTNLPIISYVKGVNSYGKEAWKNPIRINNEAEDNELENAEYKRLLYVAATRAEDHLIFTTCFGKNSGFMMSKDEYGSINAEYKKKPEGPVPERKTIEHGKPKSLLNLLGEGIHFALDEEQKSDVIDCQEFFPVFIRNSFGKVASSRKTSEEADLWYKDAETYADGMKSKIGVTHFIEETDFSSSILTPELYTSPEEHSESIPLPMIPADAFFLEVTAENFPNLDDDQRKALRSERITEFGTLTHETLENYFRGVEDDYSSYFKTETESTRKMLIDNALSLRDNFLTSSFFKELEEYKLLPEKEFYIKDKDRVVEGIIDLLCVKEDSIRIVDYKTDASKVESSHRNQLLYYIKAMETIYPGRNIEAYVFYLRDPKELLKI